MAYDAIFIATLVVMIGVVRMIRCFSFPLMSHVFGCTIVMIIWTKIMAIIYHYADEKVVIYIMISGVIITAVIAAIIAKKL